MSEDKTDDQGAGREEKRPEWMSSISGIVNPEDYLLGKKIDKTFELHQQEKVERAKEHRANLIAADKLKLKADPILDLERRKFELKLEIISNPNKLRQFREYILKKESESSQNTHPRPKEECKQLAPVPESSRETGDNEGRSRPQKDRQSTPSPSSSSSSSSTSSSRSQRHGRRIHDKKSKRKHMRRGAERVSNHRSSSRRYGHKSKYDQKYRESGRIDRRKKSRLCRRSRSRSRSSDRRDVRRHHNKRR